MSTDLPTTLKKLREAKCPEDVFGGDRDDTLDDVKPVYLLLARIMHPDMHGGSKDAHDATALLNTWWDKAKAKFTQKTWGKRDSGITIKAGKLYKNVTPLTSGDISDIYLAEQEGGPRAVIKIGYSDVDLMQNEARTLTKLWKPTDKAALFTQQFLPKLLEQTKVTVDGKERHANILEACEQGFTLEQVKERYKDGLDPRHVAWIWKRMLEAMTWVHSQDIIHGAIVPCHIIVYPKNHGICILDWSYACSSKQSIKAVVTKYRDRYPREVFEKKPARPSTDIYMIAQTAKYLLEDRKEYIPASTPSMFVSMIRACLLPTFHRSNDPREVHEQLTENLRKTYGPRKFVELEM